MAREERTCVVCNQSVPSSRVCRVVLEGRTVILCRAHAARVASKMPQTFDELRGLFPEAESGEHASRRSLIERRAQPDRRLFPPRPEGRRMSDGRRRSDAAA